MSITLAIHSSRRERRSAELRERVFRAAVQLFARKGYSETTVEDITNAADVGKGTFFNYFPSKDHILAAFGQKQIEKLQLAAEAAASTKISIREFMRSLALNMISEPARNPAMVRVLVLANLSSEPVRKTMREVHTKATELLARIVKVGQDRDEIRKDMDPLDIAQTLRQALLGALLIWSLYGDGSLEARIENVISILWNGLDRTTSLVHTLHSTEKRKRNET
jgi:AcrR family transcriptional regulator